ncbi:MAG TPA: ABC transporter ATP-binding protein, partial [Acidimicrobiales bacterium]|nr:ABC transporter ATP-binding protein [Acidimicrobiales bacterium]
MATTLAGAKELRVFGFAPTAVQRFDDHGSAQARLYEHVFRRSSYTAWPAWIAVVAAVGLPTWVIVQSALDGDVSVGRLATVISAVLGMQVIGAVGNETFMVEAALSSVESLAHLEALAEEPVPRPPRRALTKGEWRPPTITFDDVSFTYPTAQAAVFEHLTLTLEPGRSVAIVGENGVGKSTLIKL